MVQWSNLATAQREDSFRWHPWSTGYQT